MYWFVGFFEHFFWRLIRVNFFQFTIVFMLIKLVPLWYDNYKWLNTFLHSLFLFWPNSVHALLSIKLIFFEFGFFLVRFVIVHLVPHWRDEKRETGKVETSKSMFVFPTFSPHTYMNQITLTNTIFGKKVKLCGFDCAEEEKSGKKLLFVSRLSRSSAASSQAIASKLSMLKEWRDDKKKTNEMNSDYCKQYT